MHIQTYNAVGENNHPQKKNGEHKRQKTTQALVAAASCS